MRAGNNFPLEVFENWTLRVRHPLQTPSRLLLLLHGWTGDENSMWIFVRNFPGDYMLIAPRAPYPADGTGYSWRLFDKDSFSRPNMDSFQKAADDLIQLVDTYCSQKNVDARQFDVMGFSQGAALSNVLTCLYPHRIRRAAILAGFMPSGLDEIISQRPLQGKQIFVSHGTQDNMIPLDRAIASMSLLEQAGAQLTYCEAEVGHKVSSKCVRGLEEFFSS